MKNSAHAQFRNTAEGKDSFKQAFKYFVKCLQLSNQPVHQAKVWFVIGKTIKKPNRSYEFQESLVEELSEEFPDMKEKLQNPEQCYEAALQLDPENISFHLHFGRYFLKIENLSKAEERLSGCISKAESLADENLLNFVCRQAYVTRAEVYKIMAWKRAGFFGG